MTTDTVDPPKRKSIMKTNNNFKYVNGELVNSPEKEHKLYAGWNDLETCGMDFEELRDEYVFIDSEKYHYQSLWERKMIHEKTILRGIAGLCCSGIKQWLIPCMPGGKWRRNR